MTAAFSVEPKIFLHIPVSINCLSAINTFLMQTYFSKGF